VSEHPPTGAAARAKELARDDPSVRELANCCYDLPHVCEVLVNGNDEEWRPTEVTVGFYDDGFRGTGDVATIMQRAGWRFERAVFAPYNRLTFVRRGAGGESA
jgi:hypothetical protein